MRQVRLEVSGGGPLLEGPSPILVGSTVEPLFTTHLPFWQQIMKEPILHHFKASLVETYNGTTDPCNHLESYKIFMMLQGILGALMCKSLPTIIWDAA